ncbi:MAG TPA: nucleoside triphosphate pyrophosphohydrolase [Alphaproteobacteria bacterium]|nr:nucleoside triphosphate pyrophosphohydrolase [Alphaproteobacteria bacterium]
MIKKIFYNKLVRDKLPQIIKKSGGQAEFKKLTPKQFQIELFKKVNEESTSLPGVRSKKELVSELADIIAVIEEIKKFRKITDKDIQAALDVNMERKGGFKKKLFLVWSEDTGYKTNEKRNVK